MLRIVALVIALAVPLGTHADLSGLDVEPLPATDPLAADAVRRDSLRIVEPADLDRADAPKLRSFAALVIELDKGQALLAKNTDLVMPIASITKLMTAMVTLDAGLPLDETMVVEKADVDHLKGTRSKMKVGTTLTRGEMLKLALMASENRAAAALARTYPGGPDGFVEAMNRKAAELGMHDTRFVDATGLSPGNVSTAQNLARLVHAGYRYPLIREFTTTESYQVAYNSSRRYKHFIAFRNSNSLVRNKTWDIGLSKTGYISEAGRCLVMQATISAKPVIIVLLDSWGKFSRVADAQRIKHWIEMQLGGGGSGRRFRVS